MPRLKKCRRICALPRCSSFDPLEGAADGRMEVAVEEYEAIHLINLLDCAQEECAAQIGVVCSAVRQMYDTAQRRLAQTLVGGRRLHISGGDYVFYPREGECPGWDCTRRDRGTGHYGCGTCLRSRENQEVMKMKIAATYKNGQAFRYFDHTEQFEIYEATEGKVASARMVGTGSSGHGALVGFLRGLGVGTLIYGGIGGSARSALVEAGIQLYPGAPGSVDVQVEALLDGSLAYDLSTVCSHRDHSEGHTCEHHHRGGHTCGGHDHGCGHHG